MTEHFDPYHKWLGIPPKDQPPNHYRLLGVEKFETDREVIDAAANRLMAYLQDLSTGENAAPAQRLLNQVAAARLMLLNPANKATYDQQLKADSAPMARPVVGAAPPMATPVQAVGHPPAAPPTPATPAAAPANTSAGPFVVTDKESSGVGAAGKRSGAPGYKARRNPSYAPIILLSLAAVVMGGIAYYTLTRPAPPAPPPPETEFVIIEEKGGPTLTAPKTDTRLRIDIPDQEREGVLLSVDRRKRPVPKTGQIAFDLKPGPHTVVIRRPGYLTIDRDVDVTQGKTAVLKANWKVDENAAKRVNEFDIPDSALDDLNNAKPTPEEDGKGEKADGAANSNEMKKDADN